MASEVAGPAFGAMLRRLRLEANLSQELLAERARMSVDAISTLERGTRRSPQRQTLALLVDALGLDGARRKEFEAAASRSSTERTRGRPATAVHRPAAPRNHNLPFPLNSFVGRVDERAALAERLTDERLITLAGTGGVGKTRLAIEIGHAVAGRFADGAWFVELAEIHDPALTVGAMCAAIGVREEAGAPLIDTMIAALASSQHLLIVDNCEHLVASVAPLIGKLLAQSPRLRVLVTSREPLHVIGERVHRVAPLDTGSARVGEPVAVTLFLERARAAAADITIDDATRAAVRTIVTRLDGIPLAIELAAAQVGVLSIAAIADRLERRLGIPGDAYRVGRSQRTTVRASIDWSYELLEPVEQTLFRRLAVFSGGFTLEAVETIVADTPFDQVDVLDLVSRLADKSMIVADPSRERFRMLETIREYALEKLAATGERARYAGQHAAYYLDYAERHGNRLRGATHFEAYAALRAELGNIRDALDATRDVLDRDERALRALAAMMEYWWVAGSFAESRAHIASLQQLALPPSPTLAAIYFGAAQIAISESAFEDARVFSAAAAEACAGAPNPVLELSVAAGDLLIEVLGDRRVSLDRFDEMRRQAESLGDPLVLETIATAQAFDAIMRGDARNAERYFEEALTFSRRSGDPMSVAATSLTLARMCLIESDPPRAAHVLAEAVPILAQRDHLTALATALDGLAIAASSIGVPESATFFLGAARRLHRVSGVSGISTLAAPVPEGVVATLRGALGNDAFESLTEAGEGAFVSDVVDAVQTFSDAIVSR